MKNKSDMLLTLHQLEGVGWRTILHVIGLYEELSGIARDQGEKLNQIPRMSASKRSRIVESAAEDRADLIRKDYESRGIKPITLYDESYPALLRETAEPPWVLYTIGNLALLHNPLLALVGTRTPTAYGKKVAEHLASELSGMGFTIASGMARGIDTAAHKGALRGEGSTIAVLGCGIDRVYPPENRQLYRDIADHGLIISEYPPGVELHPGMFPVRNRIIAGMCLGTVVVEAARRSGSLITADQAMNESRDVFAVPGPITSPRSEGALELLKQGAALVTQAQDIAGHYPHLIRRKKPTHINNRGTGAQTEKLSEDEAYILSLISAEPITFDELLVRSKFNFGHLHSVLLSLLLTQKIEQNSGSTYTCRNI